MKLVRSSPPQQPANRAEASRQRRSQASQKRTTNVTRNLVKPAARAPQPPPVTVRGTRAANAAPARGKTRAAPRRQFYYSLDATGAEVRLPSVPMLHPGWRLLSGALVLIFSFLIYLAYNDARFQVSEVEYSGLKRIKAAEVTELLDLNNLPIFMVNPQEIHALLAISFPELTDVKIVTGLPAVVQISVTERQPVLAWKTGEHTYWVDKTGFIFPARGEAANLVQVQADAEPPVLLTNIPLTGSEEELAEEKQEQKKNEIIGQTLDPHMLSAAQALGKKTDGASLVYSSKDGLGWNDSGGWTAFVGIDLSNINLKLKVYQAVVKKLSEDGITPVMVSVENVNAPIYRLE